jgi:hypothetical protein
MDNKDFDQNIFNLEPGDCFYNHQDHYKHHIVLLLLNEPIPQIIYKYFGKHKRWWHYQIESMYGFNLMWESKLYAPSINELRTK